MKQPIDTTKIQRTRRGKINSVEQKRWAAYATAALASGFSLSLATSAEGRIHYSGLINQELEGDSSLTFQLGDGGALVFQHAKHYFGTNSCTTCSSRPQNLRDQQRPQTSTRYYDGGSAFIGISLPSGAVRGQVTTDLQVSVSHLAPHDAISAGPFASGGGFLAERCGVYFLGTCFPRGQFQEPTTGAVGFRFNTGAGVQYGWVRVRMEGFPDNKFTIVDYAYGDPGDVVQVGRRRSSDSAPTLESLGGLALGAAGLLAWRRRANKRAAV